MTWKELKDKISLMTEEEQRQNDECISMQVCGFFGSIVFCG